MNSQKLGELGKLACDPGCFTTTLTLMAVSELGLECLDWEPEIVVDAFEKAYGISRLPQKACDKLQTGLMLVGTNAFTATLEGFLAAAKVMSNGRFDESETPYCTLPACSWAVFEYLQLTGEVRDGKPAETFSPDVVGYIQEAGRLNGVSLFPEWLSFADSPAEMPDLSGDVSMFEAYNARQQDYDARLVEKANEKQRELARQLMVLRDCGVLAENAAKPPENA